MRPVIVLAILAGCYAPSTPADVACGVEGACPHGQRCQDGRCTPSAPSIDASGSDAPGDATAEIDAPFETTCAGGDDVCLVACVGSDPDCTTTCGDGRCVGNAGELCGNCATDCATTTPVCGNAACEPGEAPDCVADCGPAPWTWASDEAVLLDLINDARTSGAACPNGTGAARPALTLDASMQPAAREWVWEIVHHEFFLNGGAACNGRSYGERRAMGGFNGYVSNRNASSVQAAFDAWMASESVCNVLMSTSPTKVAIAVAVDAQRGHLVLLK